MYKKKNGTRTEKAFEKTSPYDYDGNQFCPIKAWLDWFGLGQGKSNRGGCRLVPPSASFIRATPAVLLRGIRSHKKRDHRALPWGDRQKKIDKREREEKREQGGGPAGPSSDGEGSIAK